MSKPVVSIIIPAYNSGRWLAETLESALAQTWRPLEIIVVNDGSTDDTASIAGRYTDRELPVKIISQNNLGLSGARNSGLRAAAGKFIQFLDADDLLSADKIQRQMELLEHAPSNTLALSRWGRFRTDVGAAHFKPSPLWRDFDSRSYLKLTCRRGGVAFPHSWLVPRTLIDEVGEFNEQIRVTEDVEFFSRVVLASSGIRFEAEGCCFYRCFHATTLSKLRNRMSSESLLLSAECVERNVLSKDSSAEMRRACADNYQNVIYKLPVHHQDLLNRAKERVTALGGSDVRPILGKRGRMLARLIGWRAVQWLRIRLWTRGIYLGKSEFISE